ncbi:MAG: 30S ribosomal protein S18 [Candidatus Wildermuthbacteria bacterium]|nr:30S ribosomal protein S18 [Candidatus Wildermuthbacteria bacterium]
MDCILCKKNIQEIDFRDTALLKRYVSGLGKIRSKAHTGLCATHQRRISRSIKRARHIGLLSPTGK